MPVKKSRSVSLGVFAKRILKEVATTIKGETKVDWELYAKKMQETRDDSVEHEVNWALFERGVLCFSSNVQPCYRVETGGIPLGPSVFSGTSLCFVRLEDAQAYQKARFGKALYETTIYQVAIMKPKGGDE